MKTKYLFYRTLLRITAVDENSLVFKVVLPGWSKKMLTLPSALMSDDVRKRVVELLTTHKKVLTFAEATIGVDKAKDMCIKNIDMPGDQHIPTWEEIVSGKS